MQKPCRRVKARGRIGWSWPSPIQPRSPRRAARDSGQGVESFGSDEEGDVLLPEGGSREGAWVNIGSKKT
jgi:hypothetical protein